MKFEILDVDGNIVNTIIADLDFVQTAYPGLYREVSAPPAPPTPVPHSVTMRQARLALLAAGLLDLVETAIAGAGPAAKIEWDYATEVQRSAGLVPAMATALGLTDEQIDALFVTASTL